MQANSDANLRHQFVQAIRDCLDETGEGNELIRKIQNGEHVDEQVLKRQCFCINRKLGVQDDSGNIIRGNLEPYLNKFIPDEEKRKQAFEKCILMGGTPEDTAYYLQTCLRDFIPRSLLVE